MDWKAIAVEYSQHGRVVLEQARTFLHEHLQHGMFMLSTRNGIDHRKFDMVRILEGLVIAGLTAMATMYGVQKFMEAEIQAMKRQADFQWAEVIRKIDNIDVVIKEERRERIDGDREVARKMDSMYGWRPR